MAHELAQIKEVFDGFNIPLSMEWLTSCLEWCKDGNMPPNYTLKDLQLMIFEQWLILDLRVVEVPSLPRNVSTQKKYVLSGTYCLQLMQVVDISKPKLWQLQRIRNKVPKNTDPKNDFGKRVLQLTLTDGVQEVEAMEFKPIPCLSINLNPGTKIKITGPITIRNGRLMLESHHVKILGGLVDELAVEYAAENVLARALHLEENPNPRQIDEKVLEVNDENPTQATQNPNVPHQSNQNTFLATTNQNTQPKPNQNIIPPEFEVDDELLRELEDDFEESSVRSFKSVVKSDNFSKNTTATLQSSSRNCANLGVDNRKGICKSPDLFEEMEIDEELLNDHLNQIDLDTMAPSKITKKDDNRKKIKTAKDVPNQDDSFDNIDIDTHLDKIDEEMRKLPSSTQISKIAACSPPLRSIKTDQNSYNNQATTSKTLLNVASSSNNGALYSAENPAHFGSADPKLSPVLSLNSSQSSKRSPQNVKVLSIEKLKKILPNIGKGKFKIKIKFKEVVKKLSVDDKTMTYEIIMKVEDVTGDITLRVDNQVITGWAEFEARDLIGLRKLIDKDDEEAKRKLIEVLGRILRKLQALDDIVEVQITRGEEYPVLINVI